MSISNDNAARLLALLEKLRPHLFGPAVRRLHKLQLSPSHHRMLRALTHASPLPMKELAEQLEITPPSITVLARRLVETGLVDRRGSDEDSRVVLIKLTAAGHALHDEITAEQLQAMGSMLAALSADEQATFLELFERALAGAGTPSCRPDEPEQS